MCDEFGHKHENHVSIHYMHHSETTIFLGILETYYTSFFSEIFMGIDALLHYTQMDFCVGVTN